MLHRLQTWFDADERIKLSAWSQVAKPMWIVDIETPLVLWANTGGLRVWRAGEIEELWARDFGSKVKTVRAHLEQAWHQAEATGPLRNRSTLYPVGQPVTIDLHASAMTLSSGLRVLLIEAEPVTDDDPKLELQRQLVTLRYTPVPVAMYASNGRLSLSNPAYFQQFAAAGLDELSWLDEGQRAAILEVGPHGLELEVETDDHRVFLVRADPGRDPEDGLPVVVVSFSDVTVRARQRKQLEHVARAASHDLRSPLNAVQRLGGWLVEDHAAQLGPDGRQIVEMMMARVSRMGLLLDGLLSYNVAGNSGTMASEVDLERLVHEVIDGMPDTSLDVRVAGPLPVVCLEVGTLYRVLWNLVDNAIKHHDRADGVIEVRAVVAQDLLRLSVEDDGPGIPPHLSGRVFAPFETLHSRDVREGAGMGLAIVKREVESVGGRILLSSDGRGARFDVEWPLFAGHSER